nr:VOC family protein [Bacillus mobilis]
MNHLFRVQLYVNDIEKSLLFYEEVISLQLYKRSMHGARFNHDQFSLLLVSDSRLNENHYFYN